jgi:hypothetical protein
VEESIAKIQRMVHHGRVAHFLETSQWPLVPLPSLSRGPVPHGSPTRDRRRCQRLLLWLNAPHAPSRPRRTTPDRGQSGATDDLGGRVGNAARRLSALVAELTTA